MSALSREGFLASSLSYWTTLTYSYLFYLANMILMSSVFTSFYAFTRHLVDPSLLLDLVFFLLIKLSIFVRLFLSNIFRSEPLLILFGLHIFFKFEKDRFYLEKFSIGITEEDKSVAKPLTQSDQLLSSSRLSAPSSRILPISPHFTSLI